MTTALQFEALGTRWSIETPQPLSAEGSQQILALAARFEAAYSRFRLDSLVGRMAQGAGAFDFPAEAARLFDLYDRLDALTGGAVDPLVGGDLERLGYDREYSLTPSNKARAGLSWARDVRRAGTSLITAQPLKLDFGAAGKGLLIDLISEVLAGAGQSEYVVDGSGDLRHAGKTALAVGLEHPFEPELVIGTAHLQNAALCASAINRRAWGEGLHHVIDARSGQPTRDVTATWVTAPDAMTADGLATALFFVSPAALAASFDFSGVQMFADGRAAASGNFQGELFKELPGDDDIIIPSGARRQM